MNAAPRTLGGEDAPLVAVICRAPIVYEALIEAFDGLASLARLDPDRSDLAGLLESLAPDAVVVDSEDAAAAAANGPAPVVQLSLLEPSIRVRIDGRWRDPGLGAASPETIRNVVVSSIFGRQRLE